MQFGRPIGSFQTVANRLVDVRSDLDALRLLVHRAAENTSAIHVAAMKSYANWTASATSTHTHQVMGAIGFTMEHDLQLYTRRLKAFETMYGSTAAHLERVAAALGLVG